VIDVSNLVGVKFRNHRGEDVSYDLFMRHGEKDEIFTSNISIIYGENGSGKSTLARKIAEASVSNPQVHFFSKDKNELTFLDSQERNIFVFSEDYISENIQIKKDERLKNIVLFGDDVEVDSKLQNLRQKKQDAKKKLESLKEKLNLLENKVDEIKEEIRETVSSPEGWAGRELDIKRSQEHVGEVDDNFIEELSKKDFETWSMLEYKKNLENFNKKLDKHKNLPDYRNAPKPINLVDPYPIYEVVELLSSAPEVQDRSELKEGPLQLLEQYFDIDELEMIYEKLSRQESFCPTCLREIPSDYLELLISMVKNRMSVIREVGGDGKITSRVRYIDIPEVSLYKPSLSSEYYKVLESLFIQIKEANERINNLIIEKSKNPFKQIIYDEQEWLDLVGHNVFIDKVNSRVNEYWFDNGDRLKKLESDLIHYNLQLAFCEAQPQLAAYKASAAERKGIVEDIKHTEHSIHKFDTEIGQLEKQHLNVDRAVDEINYYLNIIFSKKNISIEIEDGEYVVTNEAGPVYPGQLSTGERNILALCYFFVSIANYQRYEEAFLSPKLIVLDDPVSSFDFDNKYGMLIAISSFCRYVLRDSKNLTKILVLTHDLASAYEMDKIMNGIDGSIKKFCCKLLSNKIERIDFENFDYYQIFLEKAYRFARGEMLATDRFTANELRRMFEAYSTFELRRPVTTVLDCNAVKISLQRFGRDISVDSFAAIRGFIHRDSHAKTQIRHGNMELGPALTCENFKRFARDILCLMYIISPGHLEERLCLGGDTSIFDQWLVEIAGK